MYLALLYTKSVTKVIVYFVFTMP